MAKLQDFTDRVNDVEWCMARGRCLADEIDISALQSLYSFYWSEGVLNTIGRKDIRLLKIILFGAEKLLEDLEAVNEDKDLCRVLHGVCNEIKFDLEFGMF